MRKFLVILSVFVNFSMYSQLKMSSTYNVGIGIDPSTVYRLSVKKDNFSAYFGSNDASGGRLTLCNNQGVFLNTIGLRNSYVTRIGINYTINGMDDSYNYVVYGNKNAPVIELNAEDGSISLFGEEYQNGTSNYRAPNLRGGIKVAKNGYVKIGATYLNYIDNPQWPLDISGECRVNGAIVVTSDARLKTNIDSMQNCLSSLSKLKGKSYNFKKPEQPQVTKKLASSSVNDSSITNATPEESKLDTERYNRRHMGFIAQEMREIYPDLVYEDANGLLSIDYISLIPLITEALKELDTKTSEALTTKKTNDSLVAVIKTVVKNNLLLEQRVKTLEGCVSCKKQKSSESTDIPVEQTSSLGQNSPNPFSVQTNISYTIAQDVQKATLYVYDMQGNQKKSYPISTRGQGSITIKGYEYSAGMYMYSLIVDGKEVDTKRMILTE